MEASEAIVRYAPRHVLMGARPALDGLPQEVLEVIFSLLAMANSPKNCVALAQTCKQINVCWIAIKDRAKHLYQLRFENPILSPGPALGMHIPTLRELHGPLIQEVCAYPEAIALEHGDIQPEALEKELETSLAGLKDQRYHLKSLRGNPPTIVPFLRSIVGCWSLIGTVITFFVIVVELCKLGVRLLRLPLLLAKILGIVAILFSIPLALVITVFMPFYLIGKYIYGRIRYNAHLRHAAPHIPPLEAGEHELERKCAILLNRLGRTLNAELEKEATKDITVDHPVGQRTAKIKKLFADFTGTGLGVLDFSVATPLGLLILRQEIANPNP